MEQIRIGVSAGDPGGVALDDLLSQIREAEEAGFHSVWIPNIFGADAMTLAALAGGVTRRIEVGTAVVPTFSRHPFYAAQQALTTQAALDGRFVFGLGPSHKVVIENMLGLSYAKPARHVREYVTVVRQLFDTGKADFGGEVYRVKGGLSVACGAPPPLLIGALGPAMRRIAGELCGGTITWMTGPRTLGEQVGPGVREAARAAGRREPRIVAGVPVCVTQDPDGARARAGEAFAMYGMLPSYRAMLDSEGVDGPAGIAVVGDEGEVERAIRRYADAGVTDFHASPFPHGADRRGSIQRTLAVLAELARGR
jgi:F420-dependent oxidoreductase-like protein